MKIKTNNKFKRTFVKVFSLYVFVGGCIDPRALPFEVTVAMLIGLISCGIYTYHILKDKELILWDERSTVAHEDER